MCCVRMPSERSLTLAVWTCAGLLAAMAVFSPRPVTGVLLLAISFALVSGHAWCTRRAARYFRRKAEQSAQSVTILKTAQDLSGNGLWCIELHPRRHLWSAEMCGLAGLPEGTAPSEELLEEIMPEGLRQLELGMAVHATDPEPFEIEFEVCAQGAMSRVLRARARNAFSPEGEREQVFMVIRDVTEKYLLQRDRDVALETARLARKEADTDALTGLANRRCAMAALDRAVADARRSGEPVSLIVFDIDHFKQVNDRHGHLVGDRVITKVGRIAQRQAREKDCVGRIGGEEFLWLMPGCDAPSALHAAERLRWAIEAGTHSAPIPSITISAGHAELEEGDAALMLFARADEALYAAKREGRNRVAQAA